MKRIAYSKAALRALSRMPAKMSKLIRSKIDQYAVEPASLANMVKAIKGPDPLFRMRVGDYRVLFTDTGDVIAIEQIGHRSNVYDRL